MTFQLILLISLGAFLLIVLMLPRQDALRKVFVVAFISTMIVFSAVPKLSTTVANWFGIGRGADFLFYVSHLVLFFIAFMYYLKFRELEIRFTKLVRYLAIAEFGKTQVSRQTAVPPPLDNL